MNLRAIALLFILFLSTIPASATAQERPAASMLQTQRSEGVDEGTAGAFDRMLRQQLDALGVVTVSGAVVLDLEQVQIALGCLGETVQCLQAVTGELGVQILLVPSIDRVGEETVANVLLFDARDASQRRASRRATSDSALLEEVDPMLRELFQLPPRAAPDLDMRGGGGAGGGGARPMIPAHPGLGVAPFVVIGAGAAALVAGAVLGAIHESSESEYRSAAAPATSQEVDAVLAIRSRAETEGYVATGLFVGGGVLAGAGLIWLLAAGNEDGSSPLAVLPYAGPGGAGVALAGTFDGGSL